MKVVLVGIPGAGKSTQGNVLSHQLGVPYLSTGHIFRQIAKEKTPLGRYVKEVMTTGLLIPDEKTLSIVEEYLSRPEYQKGYILDGFPRTIEQAEKFQNGIDKVIYIEIPDKEAVWRLAYRNDSVREDDTLKALTKRIEVFHKQTAPVIDYYGKKNQLLVVDGTKSISDVNKQILKGLGKQIVKNRLTDWTRKRKIILAIVGLYGSGKTEAAGFFKQKGLPIVHFGSAVTKEVERRGFSHTEDAHKSVREELREKHGMQALAVLNTENIKQALEISAIVVIDGLRSFEEYEYLKQQFKNTDVVVVATWARRNIRNTRLSKRKDRSALKGIERDLNEVVRAHMGPTIALADHIVINDTSLDDFYYKLENIYRTIYFA